MYKILQRFYNFLKINCQHDAFTPYYKDFYDRMSIWSIVFITFLTNLI